MRRRFAPWLHLAGIYGQAVFSVAGVCLAENYSLAVELCVCIFTGQMAERDPNKEALRQVEKATGTDPVDGKDLLESDALRRQLDEAKQSLHASAKPSGKKPVK